MNFLNHLPRSNGAVWTLESLRVSFEDQLQALTNSLKVQIEATSYAIGEASTKAQTANNELERLIRANMLSIDELARSRFAALGDSMNRIESVIKKVEDVAVDREGALEQKLINQIIGLRDMVALRAQAGETAIAKAEQATDLRFASITQQTSVLANQAREFVTSNVLDARIAQMTSTRGAELQVVGDLKERISRLETMKATEHEGKVEGHLTVGSVTAIIGGALGVLSLLVSVAVGYENRPSATAQAQQFAAAFNPSPFNPTVGADTKRVDDLINRLDSLARTVQQTQQDTLTATANAAAALRAANGAQPGSPQPIR